MRKLYPLLLIAFAGCMGEGDPTDLDAPDSGSAAESGRATEPDVTLNGCSSDDYADRTADTAERVIAVAAMGLTYTPRCTTIRTGQRVRWEGSLTAHPLAPGNPRDRGAGSPGNPIAPTSSGREVEFEFPSEGDYPYYCTLHAFGAGEGMAGVIRVRGDRAQGTTSNTSSSRN